MRDNNVKVVLYTSHSFKLMYNSSWHLSGFKDFSNVCIKTTGSIHVIVFLTTIQMYPWFQCQIVLIEDLCTNNCHHGLFNFLLQRVPSSLADGTPLSSALIDVNWPDNCTCHSTYRTLDTSLPYRGLAIIPVPALWPYFWKV